jgi:AraC-like DNA-binding protein
MSSRRTVSVDPQASRSLEACSTHFYNGKVTGDLVSIGILSQLALYAKSLGISVERLFTSLGMDPALLGKGDARISFEEYVALEDRAAELSDDPYFGLHMGESIQPGHYGIIGYMMMNSANLGEAMTKLGRYNRLIGTVIGGRLALGIGKVRLIFTTPGSGVRLSRHCVECAMASVLTLARQLTGTPLHPLAANLATPRPQSTSEYERVFACSVQFERRENAFLLDARIGTLPLSSPNPELLSYFERYAESCLQEVELSGPVSAQVMRTLLGLLDRHNVGLRDVARELGLGARTLQKRLEEEGVRFRDLLAGTRKELAARYVRENRTVEEISYLLGYSNASSFSKAFKKWHGIAPRNYRRTHEGTS